MKKLLSNGFSFLIIFLMIVVIGGIAGAGWYVTQKNKDKPNQPAMITNFEECVAAGNPVMESFPEQCVANNQTFTKPISSYQECISAGHMMLKSDPPRCEADGRMFTAGE